MPKPFDVIREVKSRLGTDLAILAHHYQTDAVIRHADFIGDSLELSRRVPSLAARHIVFCGVSFMAESAAILAAPGQRIHAPSPDASCSMSDMVPAALLQAVLDRLTASGRRLIPLAYVNTDAAVKAICGRNGGAVCTSANAPAMLRWASEQGDGVLFVPDKNLALNTANILGIPEARRHLLRVTDQGGNLDLEAAARADLLVWPGCCSVHQRLKAGHVRRVRTLAPGVRVVVHPECRPEVVQAADAAGSTSFIIRYVEDAPEGSTIAVGTENNLVQRLADRHRALRTVFPLFETSCLNMNKTTEGRLAALLSGLEDALDVTVPDDVREPARVALDRMLVATAAR